MKKGTRRQLEDIPDLIHHIQSLLPFKEAARTSVLSKSWLHAWSTIPTLRFREALSSVSEEQERDLLKVFNRTLIRYLDDNIPINSIDHKIYIENQDSSSSSSSSSSLAEKWIRLVAMKDCLKELSLEILLVGSESLMLPDEILSGKNLTKIRISAWNYAGVHSVWMTSSPVINCVFLKELHLDKLHISEEVLDAIFCTCKLLVKIKLLFCKGEFKTIKIKNLGCLNELTISTVEINSSCTVLEVDNVPNLSLFICDLRLLSEVNPLPYNGHSLSLGTNVTQLCLHGLIIDDACMDVIKSSFPFLKILSLNIRFWRFETLEITCDSMETLSLVSCPHRVTSIKVNAPKFTYFGFEGTTIPSLKFSTRLKQIKIVLSLRNPVLASFFVKMWKALKLSSNCYIEIKAMNSSVVQPPPPFEVDIPNLRERVPFPAKNVRQLSYETTGDEGHWKHSPFFDAVFSICHPKRVVAKPDAMVKHGKVVNPFFNLMVSEVMEKNTNMISEFLHWPYFLKDFEIEPENENPRVTVFKLNWR